MILATPTICPVQTFSKYPISCLPLCRSRAEGVKDIANKTQQALDVSEKAIEKARTALKEARNNLNSTRNATAEVQHSLNLSVLAHLCFFYNNGFTYSPHFQRCFTGK